MDTKLSIDNEKAKIGLKETMRALRKGSAERVIIAKDADYFVTRRVREYAEAHGVEIIEVSKKSKLGDMCDIDVAAAVAVIIK